MTSILFIVETIQCKQFRCIYGQNKKLFLSFCVHFSNLHQILKNFQKRWLSPLMNFRNYGPPKTWLYECLKSPVWDNLLTGNILNGLKHWFNLNPRIFAIFVDHCEGTWVEKVTRSDMQNLKTFFLRHWLPMTSILFLVERIQCKQFRYIYLSEKQKTFP